MSTSENYDNYSWNQQALIITQGLPGSGKSTWAKRMVAEHSKVMRVNRDEIRLELGFVFNARREGEVTAIQNKRVTDALNEGWTVITDDTYLNPAHIKHRRQEAAQHGVVFVVNDSFMLVSVEECIKRDLMREHSVGKDVIEELYFRYYSRIPIDKAIIDLVQLCKCKKHEHLIATQLVDIVLAACVEAAITYGANEASQMALSDVIDQLCVSPLVMLTDAITPEGYVSNATEQRLKKALSKRRATPISHSSLKDSAEDATSRSQDKIADLLSTESPQQIFARFILNNKELAPSVDYLNQSTPWSLITTILQDVFEDSFVLDAIRVSAISEIAKKLSKEHLSTCVALEYFRCLAVPNGTPKPLNHGPHTAILCDMVGTLAIIPSGANVYTRDFTKDTYNFPVGETIKAMLNMGHNIIIISGREDVGEARAQTEAWLQMHHVPYDFLYMRPQGNHQKDTVVKKKLYMDHIHSVYEVVMAIDDRPSVVRMWRAELGLTVFQVAPNIEF